jgi:hypothetical protein
MIYLKKFNESNSTKKDEILKFCEENLGYLLDSGFGIIIVERADDLNIEFDRYDSKIFKWEDIMDDFVPFIELFDMNFGLKKLKPTSERDKFSKKCSVILNTKKHGYRYRLQDLVDDNVSGILHIEIESIDFFTEK